MALVACAVGRIRARGPIGQLPGSTFAGAYDASRFELNLINHRSEISLIPVLREITMETEAQFDVWLPEKSVLDTAAEVFGAGVLEKDGCLTEDGKRLMTRRMPAGDAASFTGEIAVK